MPVSGRQYVVTLNGGSITAAAQDLISITAGATKILAITSVNIGQITATTVTNARIRLRYLPVTVTAGTGGSAVTPRPWLPGDAAAVATARSLDTGQATSSGTAIDLWDDTWNLLNGFLWVPPNINRPPVIGLSGAFVLSLDASVGAVTGNISVTFEELP